MPARLGQHFLKNENILKDIAKYSEINVNDVVLEIGAGYGNLTKYLVYAKKIYAVEFDKDLFQKLKKNMQNHKNVVCVNTDILKYDFPKDVNKIVGNLPYEISSQITEKILKFLSAQKKKKIKRPLAVLMYQREFAERMVAFPGLKNYSRISILVNYYANASILRIVGKNEFRPPPKVDSAIIKIVPKAVKDDPELFKIVKLLFTHKNKKVINALIDSREYLSIKDKNELKVILTRLLGDLGNKKVFYLSLDEIKEISKKIKGLLYIEGYAK